MRSVKHRATLGIASTATVSQNMPRGEAQHLIMSVDLIISFYCLFVDYVVAGAPTELCHGTAAHSLTAAAAEERKRRAL
jgi:hypothetical protein